MSETEPKFESPIAENTEQKDPKIEAQETLPEKKELTPEETRQFAGAAIEAISGQKSEGEITEENLEEKIENSILDGVRGLPELLAEKLKTVDASVLNGKSVELLSQISKEQNPKRLAELQTELIYQYIGIISRVQNSGDKGFIPSVAKEVDGLDCSLSAWALKEKLESSDIPNISFEFGYPPGHAGGVIKVADGRQLYVDAQNGFVEEVELEQVSDPNNPDTAYPIYEIKASKRIVGHLPNEGETTRARREGSDYVPRYLGVSKDGLLHTLGNMHMLTNSDSPIFNTESAKQFRENMDKSETKKNEDKSWENFSRLVDKIAGGKTIYETKFGELEELHHAEYQKAKRKAEEQSKIDELKKKLGF